MSRRDHALQCINVSIERGLELGPLHSPVVSKQEANITYVDHLSTEGLKKKYSGHPVPGDQIVPIDYVLKGSLRETLKGKKFDYVIASHVIEHIPDTVRWLQDVASVLKPGGILSLVVPDKRFTFDVMRNESRPADVIGAYLDKHTRASSATMFDFVSEARDKIDATKVWANPRADYSKKPQNPLSKVMADCERNLKPGEYVDSHCFVFTPYSFFVIVRKLIELDLFDYEVVYFCDTEPNQLEFYVSLRKTKSPRAKKLKSLPKPMEPKAPRELETENEELRAQIQNLLMSTSWRVTKPLRTLVAAARSILK
jgi:SAM-dependent methyltransferase